MEMKQRSGVSSGLQLGRFQFYIQVTQVTTTTDNNLQLYKVTTTTKQTTTKNRERERERFSFCALYQFGHQATEEAIKKLGCISITRPWMTRGEVAGKQLIKHKWVTT